MKVNVLAMSVVAIMVTMAGCRSNGEIKADLDSHKQEREFLNDAVRHKSPDLQRVDIIDSTVVYTHIYDGIVDIKTYAFVDDVCVEAERVYTFPDQMSALRHYRRAVEQADLYDSIEMFNNQVKYDLKQKQHELETKGLTKEQLKAKFEKQIADCKADFHRHHKGDRQH